MIEVVVFDMDDTLYPERDFVLSGFRAVAEWADVELGIPSESGFGELKQLFDQGARGNIFNRWLAAHGVIVAEDLIMDLVRVYRRHEPKIRPFPEVLPLFRSLKSNYRLGLLSDGYLAVQRRKLEALSLSNHFEAVVFTDEWGRDAWKPSTKPFEIICRRMGMAPHQVVYAADNPLKDFLGARRIGMHTVWVRRPDGEYTALQPPSADHSPEAIISTLRDLPQFLADGSLNNMTDRPSG